ncbi:MAG: HAD family phosphatase [Planctomycetota bacterium]
MPIDPPNKPGAHTAIQAVVFDFDGVIADSEPVHERALLETVRGEGLNFTHEQYQTEIIGYDDRDAFPAIYRMNGKPFDPSQADRLIESKTELLHRLIAEGAVTPFPGTLDLARQAKVRGIPFAICSGALQKEIGLMLEAFGAADLFEIIVAADDVPKAKPDPAGYLITATKLGIDPAACACIEDTPTGIQAARAAGYGNIIGVAHSLPKPDLAEAHAAFDAATDLTLSVLLGDPTA